MISVHPLEHPSVLNIFQGDGKARVVSSTSYQHLCTTWFSSSFSIFFIDDSH